MITAIVPAAGRSGRMGRPKLVLPIDGQTLIGHVVTALRVGGADRVVVVAPPEDSEEGPAVARAAQDAGAFVVAPRERPAEMRDSIEIGLAAAGKPTAPGRVLLSPGDAAGMTNTVVAAVVHESDRQPEKIVVPRCGARRGHPLLLPWSLAAGIGSLPAGQGVNALLARHPSLVVEVALGDAHIADDIDSPEDFRRWEERARALEVGPAAAGTRVHVRLFALARERAGCAEIEIELAGARRVSDVRYELARRLPGLAPLVKTVMIAVNEEYADDEAQVSPGARIAVIPPVSGGAGELGRRSRRG
jgi:molybdenum cofactor cytidylyltransferase